jgi:hypothetical protein
VVFDCSRAALGPAKSQKLPQIAFLAVKRISHADLSCGYVKPKAVAEATILSLLFGLVCHDRKGGGASRFSHNSSRWFGLDCRGYVLDDIHTLHRYGRAD